MEVGHGSSHTSIKLHDNFEKVDYSNFKDIKSSSEMKFLQRLTNRMAKMNVNQCLLISHFTSRKYELPILKVNGI